MTSNATDHLKIDPNRADAEQLGLAARVLLEQGRVALARTIAEIALATDPAIGNLHSVIGGVLEADGEAVAALPHWREAARLMPNAPQQRLNLALALLAHGDFAEGLHAYESRRDKPDWIAMASAESMRGSLARTLRPGQDVAGRHVLVLTEQGLGDGIMFARFLPPLIACAGRVTVVCKPALRPLFERMEGIGDVVAPPPDQPHARINLKAVNFDVWAPLMSLPLWFGTAPDALPPPIRLHADPVAVSTWRARYAAAGRPGHRRVGLVFRANPESGSAHRRSIAIGDLAPLGTVSGIDFVNLQPGPEARTLGAVLPNAIEAMDIPIPLDQFAAAVAATDLLLSVDTMAVHCAGALNHPCWIMLPRMQNWYWPDGIAASPWYPAARLFRQAVLGDWRATIDALAAALGAWPAPAYTNAR
ncbi:MAG: hypothetical protein NT133_25250 [Alphaproteobacteria bacterium]|nr:hypothetical protein [Alphaproteobacteria bacterium]